MEVFVVINGKKEGPLTLYQLRELVREGVVTRASIGWMRGAEKWVPLEELPAALGVIQDLEREQLDEELAKRERPAVAPPPEIPYNRLVTHSLARYGARMIDILIAHLALWYLLRIPKAPAGFPDFGNPEQFMAYLRKVAVGLIPADHMIYIQTLTLIELGALLAFWLAEAGLLAWMGATPGKALFRLRVEDHEGRRPGFFRALGRTFLVFWLGLGGKIPVLEWLASFLSFLRLQNRGITVWDQRMCTAVRQDRVTRGRAVAIFLVFLLIAGAAFYLPGG